MPPIHSRQSLVADFRQLGVHPGDTVMLHASVRAVGDVAGGPDQIHLALKDALTDAGTLLMYASCPAYYDEVGRGNLTPDVERDVLDKLPAFDPITARSQRDNGALVELFRTWPDSIVNHHVARFVLWGRQARRLIETQPWDYALGQGSALDRFVALGGRILMLGSDHDTVTFLHYAEHIVDIPNKRIVRFQVPVDIDGSGTREWREMAEVDTGERAHDHWPDRFFARLVDTYLAQTHNRGSLVGHASSFLLDAPELLAFALPIMQAIAANPRAADSLLSAK
jgi:aminoglycoside 3-N-acetyltransferase